jgi:hypothetical protein
MTDALAALGVLAFAALAIDALIRPRKGDWRKSPASSADVAAIVAGKQPPGETRDGLKLVLLAVVVLGLWIVFGG